MTEVKKKSGHLSLFGFCECNQPPLDVFDAHDCTVCRGESSVKAAR